MLSCIKFEVFDLCLVTALLAVFNTEIDQQETEM